MDPVGALLGFVIVGVLVGLGLLISPTVALFVFLALVVTALVGLVLSGGGET